MTEHPEKKPGRMLFTDFDVSDKGRPVAILPVANPADILNRPIPSIADIASSLEIDFEDDVDAPPSAPPAPERDAGDKTEGGKGRETEDAPAAALPSDEDPELSLDVDAAAPYFPSANDDAPREPVAAPTWEEFTRAFRDPEPDETTVVPRPWSLRVAPDVLAAFDLPPPAASSAGAFAPDGEDVEDILSLLSAAATETEIAHGGVERVADWYSPPDEAAPSVKKLADWYEPPAEQTATARSGRTSTRARAPGPSDSSADIAVLFDDGSIDRLWAERSDARAASGSSRTRAETDTGILGLFDDLDVDSAWEERRRTADGGASGNPDETVVLDTADLEKSGGKARTGDGFHTTPTRSMPRVTADAESESAAPASPARKKRPAASKKIAEKDLEKARAESEAVLSDLARHFLGEEEPPPAETPKAAVPDADYFDEMDWRDEARSDVSAPTIGDADLLASARNGDADAEKALAPAVDEAPENAPGGGEGEDAAASPETSAVGEAEHGGESSIDDFIPDVGIADGPGIDDSVQAPRIDDTDIEIRKTARKSDTEEMRSVADSDLETKEDEPAADPVAVDPMDAFAGMDDMDFSGDVDEDMQSLLDEDEEMPAGEGESASETSATAAIPAKTSSSLPARVRRGLVRILHRIVPAPLLEKLDTMIAWHENWWFYCDLLAAIIASASLAIIISYYVWYRT